MFSNNKLGIELRHSERSKAEGWRLAKNIPSKSLHSCYIKLRHFSMHASYTRLIWWNECILDLYESNWATIQQVKEMGWIFKVKPINYPMKSISMSNFNLPFEVDNEHKQVVSSTSQSVGPLCPECNRMFLHVLWLS